MRHCSPRIVKLWACTPSAIQSLLVGQPEAITPRSLAKREIFLSAYSRGLVPIDYQPQPGDGQVWRPPLRLDC